MLSVPDTEREREREREKIEQSSWELHGSGTERAAGDALSFVTV